MPLIDWPQEPENEQADAKDIDVQLSNLILTPDEHIVANSGLTGKLYTDRFAPGGRFKIEATFLSFWADPISIRRRNNVQSFVSRMTRLLNADDPPRCRLPLSEYTNYVNPINFGTATGNLAPTFAGRDSAGVYTLSRAFPAWETGQFFSVQLTPYRRLFRIAEKPADNKIAITPDFVIPNGTRLLPAEYIECRREGFSIIRSERSDNDLQRPSIITMRLVELHVETKA